MKTCLVINLSEYNPSVINFFRKYYSGKFKNITFTCPWEEGLDEPDVISTHYMYSYWYANAAEAVQHMKKKYDYYVLTDENGVLSYDLNEFNIWKSIKKLNSNIRIGICQAKALYAPYGYCWSKTKDMIYPFIYSAAEWKDLFMPFDSAILKMVKFFGSYDKYISDSFFGRMAGTDESDDERRFKRILGGMCKIPYPLAYGPADFMIISGKCIGQVIPQLFTWASVGVYYEVAIPTISILLFEKNNINMLPSVALNPIIAGTSVTEFENEMQKNSDSFFICIPNKIIKMEI